MKENIIVQIMTNYFCNFNCEYCYLGNLKKNSKIIDIDKLKEQLHELSLSYNIYQIGLFGGEITLLPKNTLNNIIKTAKEYTNNIVITTNLSNQDIIESINKSIKISTSLNKERDNYVETFYKILSSNNKNMSLNIVVTPSILHSNIKNLIKHLSLLKTNVDFIRYSPSINNKLNYNISNSQYAHFLKEIIQEYKKKDRNFEIKNIKDIEECINKKYSPLMESVIFISPYNKYCSIQYKNKLEYFKEFDSLLEYKELCKKEEKEYNNRCNQCRYYPNCYAEHINFENNDECCGLKRLLQWYEDIYKDNRKL